MTRRKISPRWKACGGCSSCTLCGLAAFSVSQLASVSWRHSCCVCRIEVAHKRSISDTRLCGRWYESTLVTAHPVTGDDMGLGKTMQCAAFLGGLFHSRLIRCTPARHARHTCPERRVTWACISDTAVSFSRVILIQLRIKFPGRGAQARAGGCAQDAAVALGGRAARVRPGRPGRRILRRLRARAVRALLAQERFLRQGRRRRNVGPDLCVCCWAAASLACHFRRLSSFILILPGPKVSHVSRNGLGESSRLLLTADG